MKKKIIAVVGPTAVGKTELAIEIAKRFNGEVISGDAMQVYKGMDIGTAKVTLEDMQGIPHYMIDIKSPDEPFTVADYKSHVNACIEQITKRGKLPVIAGGSGLYVQAVLNDYQFSSHNRDPELTNRLEVQAHTEGKKSLYDQLMAVDPEQAKKIHPNNVRRVIRALEVYEATGLTMSDYHSKQSAQQPYDTFLIGLEMTRQRLYERINARVDNMIASGLIDEVQSLYRSGYEQEQAMKAIGYKELIPYLKQQTVLNDAVEDLKRNSRRYAKRQYTWFKNKMDVKWYPAENENRIKTRQTIFTDLEGFLQDM